MSTFDITTLRKHFPALSQNQVYFENAGGSQTLGTVIDAISKYLTNNNVQLGATYPISAKSTQVYGEGYEAAAKYINASPDNVVIGSSTTQLFRNLSFALEFPEGSELLISAIDHEANIAAWVDLATRQKLTIKWWSPKTKTNPRLLASDLPDLLTPKTVLVACTHASNILGTIHDITAIATEVHKIKGAMLCVDGVAYAPHRQLDMVELGVDFYAFSWYKVYGPHCSMLYASPTALPVVKNLGHYFNPSATLQQKLGLAGSSYELVAAIPAVLDYFGTSPKETWAAIESHEGELQTKLLTYLKSRPEIEIIGEGDPDTKLRLTTISFLVKGWKSEDLVLKIEQLSGGEMGIRWGGMYSVRLIEGILGLDKDAVVKASMVHYNTVEEVKKLIGLLDQVLKEER